MRARVEASGDTEGAAAILASRVMIDGSGGQVRASGPESADNSWWSVSYEIFVPQATDLTLKTLNGGLTISDVRGQIQFDALNGGVHVKRVAGEVSGKTMNGGIDVELAGAIADWRQMELSTIMAALPSQCRRITPLASRRRPEWDTFSRTFHCPRIPTREFGSLDFNVGSGGPPIHITTGNGGIRLKRVESQ